MLSIAGFRIVKTRIISIYMGILHAYVIHSIFIHFGCSKHSFSIVQIYTVSYVTVAPTFVTGVTKGSISTIAAEMNMI